MKRHALILILFLFISWSAFAQLVIAAGADGYLSDSGIMPGAGASLEYAFEGCFSGSKSEQTTIGFGFEWFALTTTQTKTPGNGFVIPLVSKERILLAPNFAIDFGFGFAMAIMDVDVSDYSGGYYVDSEIGGALFGEAGILYLFPNNFMLGFNLRGGALLIGDNTNPFFGAVLMVGYQFLLHQDDSQESDY
jgi:hypothetical protein